MDLNVCQSWPTHRGAGGRRACNDSLTGTSETGNFAAHLLDLDGFMGVNGRSGMQLGGDLMRQVAARLEADIPYGALLAKFCGDELGSRRFEVDA